FDISNVNFTIEDNPVPVELVSFVALLSEDEVLLKWTTATELNNFGFEIERRLGEENWNKIGFVEGSGNSSSPKSYTFTDNNSVGGSKFHYRLKQLDNDGTYEYSNEVEVEITPNKFALFQNYPNPFNPSTVIKFSLPVDAGVTINLFNTLGEKVDAILNRDMSIGHHEVNYNASSLSNGIYYYKITANGKDGSSFVSTKKMVFMK
ncbi:MAG: T9SS type A sorting domain-containing protein, partial [Nitrososphaeraceae archaeon]|nr:T9SS type A sorting domain-containing protein [Nitrososphaeraceae archaeon]